MSGGMTPTQNMSAGEFPMGELSINEDELLETLLECISIDSVKSEPEEGNPFGAGVAEALEYLLEKGRQMGFETKNIDGYAGYIEYGSGDEMIGILGHVDVVPAGDGWESDPFRGVVRDGKVYGRGALDDKGPVIAALYALKAIKDAGIRVDRRIRLIIGTDEESGSKDIARYKQTEEIPVYAFTPDAFFPVINSEKGMVVFKIGKKLTPTSQFALKEAEGGLVVNQVPAHASLKLERNGEPVELHSTEGLAAHGSTPELGINAIDSLFEAAAQAQDFAEYPQGLKDFIEFYRNYFSGDTRGAALGADYRDETLGDATFNVGVLTGDENHIEISVDYRHPANLDNGPYLKRIEELCRREGMEFELIKQKQGLYFPPEHKLVQVLGEVYRAETGQAAKPVSMGGGTYAKSLPNTVAFGPIFPGHEDTMHQANEYISAADLMANARIYGKAMLQLAKI